MKYAVLRFTGDTGPEQWIIPARKLLIYMNITHVQITIPVKVSDHGQICNVLFCKTGVRGLYTAYGFANLDQYIVFVPPITPSHAALNQLGTMLHAVNYAQRVEPQLENDTKMYHL